MSWVRVLWPYFIGILWGILLFAGMFSCSESTVRTSSRSFWVKITSPRDGQRVSGRLSLSADVSKNAQIQGIHFNVAGLSITVENQDPPYVASLDSAIVPNGTYEITAVARKIRGGLSASASVTVVVENSPLGPATAGSTPSNQPILSCPSRSGSREIGRIWDFNILREESGIAVSRPHPNRLFHINDSGDGPNFYLTTFDGRNTTKVQINNFAPVDVEDLAYGVVNNKSYLFIGDIGDNSAARRSLELVVVEEQTTFPSTVNASYRVLMSYPDGAKDAEGMALHPNGDIYILSKQKPVRLYRLSSNQWQSQPSQVQVMQYIGELDLATLAGATASPTALDISSDGTTLLVITYSEAIEFEIKMKNGIVDLTQYRRGDTGISSFKLHNLPQLESGAYLPDSRSFIYTSESHGSSVPILQVDCGG